MPTNEEHLLKRLLVTFKTEAREHIQAIASGLVELEKAPTGRAQFAILDTIYKTKYNNIMALVSVNRGATDSGTPGCGRDVEGIHFVRGRAAMVGRDSGPGVDRVGDQKRAWRTRCVRLSAQYFIAKVTQLDQYVVSLANKVVAGPFPTAAAAVKAKENVVKPGPLKSGKGL